VALNDVGAVSVQTALHFVALCYDICDSVLISALSSVLTFVLLSALKIMAV